MPRGNDALFQQIDSTNTDVASLNKENVRELSEEQLTTAVRTFSNAMSHPPHNREEFLKWAIGKLGFEENGAMNYVPSPDEVTRRFETGLEGISMLRNRAEELSLFGTIEGNTLRQNIHKMMRMLVLAYENAHSLAKYYTFMRSDGEEPVERQYAGLHIMPCPPEEDDYVNILIGHIREHAALQGKARKNGDLYSPILHNGNKTLAFYKDGTVEDYIYRVCSNRCNPEMCKLLWGRRAGKAVLAYFVKNTPDEMFPQYEPDFHLMSFGNGVLNIGARDADGNPTLEFLAHNAPELRGKCASWFNKADLDESLLQLPDFMSIPTPSLDKILSTQDLLPDKAVLQKEREDITLAAAGKGEIPCRECDFCKKLYGEEEKELWQSHYTNQCVERIKLPTIILAHIGRMRYKLHELDRGGIMLFINGVAGAGKSMIMFLIHWMYNTGEVGTLATNTEVNFPLGSIRDSKAWVCPEVKVDFNLPADTLQKMITREHVPVKIKQKDPDTKLWEAPGMMAGNDYPGKRFMDSKNSLLRRIQVLLFKKTPKVVDEDLDQRLKEEFPAILIKALRAYQHMVVESRKTNPETGLAFGFKKVMTCRYFEKTQVELRKKLHPLHSFLANESNMLKLVPKSMDVYMPYRKFVSLFNQFQSEMMGGSKRISVDADTFDAIFKFYGIDRRLEERPWPASDSFPRKGMFVFGVTVSDESDDFIG